MKRRSVVALLLACIVFGSWPFGGYAAEQAALTGLVKWVNEGVKSYLADVRARAGVREAQKAEARTRSSASLGGVQQTASLSETTCGTTEVGSFESLSVCNDIAMLNEFSTIQFYDENGGITFTHGGAITCWTTPDTYTSLCSMLLFEPPSGTGSTSQPARAVLASTGITAAVGPTGMMFAGSVSKGDVNYDGAALAAYEANSDTVRANVRVSHTGAGYPEPVEDAPISALEVMDPSGIVCGSVRVMGSTTATAAKVRVGNRSGAEVVVEDTGDVVITLGGN